MIDLGPAVDVLERVGIATLLGGALGLDRELHERFAGLRTHMLVAMGAAVFVMAGLGSASGTERDATRVIQGIVVGIGFIGGGTILKLTDQQRVRGLTTASSIWLAAGVGTACGLADFTLAVVGTAIAVLVLVALRPLEKFLTRFEHPPKP
ncbi:MAG TPA: MgtC/SapB family protein [Gemmataceae bacterium]|jgi:putative Mg2+ transporter-C (MgtC) family protein|nr:MgtC/SapB family protein [Gemmataceae bacterium]